MKADLIHSLTDSFEAHAQETESGVLYWLARDIQHLLGYSEWRNFTAVISKAKTACEVSGHAILDYFVDVNKTIQMPKGAACHRGQHHDIFHSKLKRIKRIGFAFVFDSRGGSFDWQCGTQHAIKTSVSNAK